jgi:two-component system cell cycle sensor histidine kinase PleC
MSLTLHTRLLTRFRALTLARRIIFWAIGLLILVYGANALFVVHYYNTISERERDSRNAKATLLAEHAGRTMAAIDLSLETIAETLKTRLPLDKSTVFTQVLLDKYFKRLPQVRALVVNDQDGHVLNSTRSFPPPVVSNADREYFSEQKKWRGVGLYIDKLEIARPDNKPFLPMTRPILDNDGNFEGVVEAVTDPEYFARFYGANEIDQGEIALLERTDGAVLAGAGLSDEELLNSARNTPIKNLSAKALVVTHEVPGFSAKIVLIGHPVIWSSQFTAFMAMDVGLLLVMTVIAGWLATAAVREATAVDRETRARRMAEARLHRAIENAPAGFALFDPQDRLVLSNELYRSFFDRIKELMVPGASFADLLRAAVDKKIYTGVDYSHEEDYVRRRLNLHRAGNEEAVFKLEDGRWIMTRKQHTEEGEIVCFYTDITPLKEKEEALLHSETAEKAARLRAEEADRAKTIFLANMSHELRTPLNAIIGFSEMIERREMGPLPETYRQYGEIVRTSGQHLLLLINDILDIAKLNSGKTELHLESVDVAQIITEAVSMISGKADSARVRITTNLDALSPRIEADPVRLRQVMLNLLSNAVKFTPAGGNIDVSTSVAANELRIVVKDTGIGMAPEDIPRALEPFTQVAKEMSLAQEGTGLGLPISKSLVELHGGRFELASAPMLGTTVTIALPIQRMDRHAAEPPAFDIAV